MFAAVKARARVARGRDVDGLDVDALVRGLLGRQADRGDLRVGEGHARRPAEVGACRRVAAEDRLARDPRLVLAGVGEERALVDVADRVEPVVAVDAKLVVDLDPLALLQADGVEADAVRVAACGPRRP